MTDYSSARRKFVDWVKQSLIGEHLKDDILIANNPFDRYTTGILYPVGTESEVEEENDVVNEEVDLAEQPAKKMKYQPPSSMGFSFYIDSSLTTLRVFYSAMSFKKHDKKDYEQKWEKSSLVKDDGEEIEATLDSSTKHEVMDGRGRIDVLVRPHGDGKIITVTLSNISPAIVGEKDKERDVMAEGSLFESKLRCFIPEQAVRNYPRVSHTLLSDEEQELELRYKDERVYAIGHGVAVDWLVYKEAIEVFSDFMPVVEVPQVTANTGNTDEVLTFKYLQAVENDESVFSKLETFVDAYEDWIEQQENLALAENPEEQKVAQRLTGRMQEAKDRMRLSISRLRSDGNAQYAFAIANKAMLMQMELNGPAPANTPYAWRPFQLGFFLMALESSIDEDSDFRDCVDLIWFPTGGGKTEAYLGVMAFVFIYRRLSYSSSGGGTTAIMRYTLRLLTAQQFVRACKVVSALELIRRTTDTLGEEPFSAGLWLGGASSPNTYAQALDALNRRNFSKFVLRQCPWCTSDFSVENYQCTEHQFNFICSNDSCELGGNGSKVLPFNVVDEALYDTPPTLLIATVDKFARLPWEDRACAFFGGNQHRPPELVIQDELHLISGALGSIVGLYEVGFESILVSRGVYPKFIASTATIRQAPEQVQSLFGREKMAVFPPVGLRQKDSYFAKEVPTSEKPGRFYIGYMAFGRKRVDCLMDLAGSLIAAPQACFGDDSILKDAWWTQMVYHGSLKGVGNSRTNFQSGVPRVQRQLLLKDFLRKLDKLEPGMSEQFMQDKVAKKKGFYTGSCPTLFMENADLQNLYKQYFPVRDLTIKSLTSNQTAEENASVFEGLKAVYSKVDALDVILATNMVSVGLDEPRLALMVINGQPLTTAEYIQASSRVGRGKTPGMVFVNYYKTQARSLSHYENFRAYHRSFYRFVEPSSLTPFTRQVRNRALHAVLVSAVRHGEKGLIRNSDAELFDIENIMISKIINQIKIRIKSSLLGISNEKQKIIGDCEAHLMKLAEEWASEIATATNLRYSASDKSANSLLIAFDERKGGTGLWPTLNSMRNVEKTGLFEVDGESSVER
jgi:hypothetical protein